MNPEHPDASPESHPFPRRVPIAARVAGFSLPLFSVLPFAVTIFLLNQELQVVPLEFELVGIGGPGFGEAQLSNEVIACRTGVRHRNGLGHRSILCVFVR